MHGNKADIFRCCLTKIQPLTAGNMRSQLRNNIFITAVKTAHSLFMFIIPLHQTFHLTAIISAERTPWLAAYFNFLFARNSANNLHKRPIRIKPRVAVERTIAGQIKTKSINTQTIGKITQRIVQDLIHHRCIDIHTVAAAGCINQLTIVR